MAKRHIQAAARKIAGLYEEVSAEVVKAGELLGDTMFSPEEQELFSKLKGEVDSQLSLLTVALSAAAQGKITEVALQIIEQKRSFEEPLRQCLDDLAGDLPEDVRATTESLIVTYNDAIRKNREVLRILSYICLLAGLPSSKKRLKKYKYFIADEEYLNICTSTYSVAQKEEELLRCFEEGWMAGFKSSFDAFKQYVTSLSSTSTAGSVAGDLDE